jgi:hypothetical protein
MAVKTGYNPKNILGSDNVTFFSVRSFGTIWFGTIGFGKTDFITPKFRTTQGHDVDFYRWGVFW